MKPYDVVGKIRFFMKSEKLVIIWHNEILPYGNTRKEK